MKNQNTLIKNPIFDFPPEIRAIIQNFVCIEPHTSNRKSPTPLKRVAIFQTDFPDPGTIRPDRGHGRGFTAILAIKWPTRVVGRP